MRHRKESNLLDMTVGAPAGLLLRFSMPLILANVLQQFCSLVDTAVVGQGVGLDAFAALGAVNGFQFMLNNVVMGLAMGYEVLFAQIHGARDDSAMRRTAAAAMSLSLLMAAVLTLLVQILMSPILRLMRVPEVLLYNAEQYLRILGGGMPIILMFYITAGILRAVGDSKTPFLSMVVMAILNVALDFLFIFGLQWGVRGAAFASMLAQGASVLINVLRINSLPMLRPEREDFKSCLPYSLMLLRLGMPYATMNFLAGAGIMIVQTITNGMGPAYIAGCTAASKVSGLVMGGQQAYSNAVSAYVGQNYGAGEFQRIRRGVRAAVVIACVTAVICGLTTYAAREPLIALFLETEDPAEYALALAAGSAWMTAYCSWMPMNYLIIMRAALQGLGSVRLPVLSGVAETAIRIVISVLAVQYNRDWICYSHAVSWGGIVAVSAIGYFVLIRRLIQDQREKGGSL